MTVNKVIRIIKEHGLHVEQIAPNKVISRCYGFCDYYDTLTIVNGVIYVTEAVTNDTYKTTLRAWLGYC